MCTTGVEEAATPSDFWGNESPFTILCIPFDVIFGSSLYNHIGVYTDLTERQKAIYWSSFPTCSQKY